MLSRHGDEHGQAHGQDGERCDEANNINKMTLGVGSPGRIRTSDQPVNSRLLYR
jgi:hypothetical protein